MIGLRELKRHNSLPKITGMTGFGDMIPKGDNLENCPTGGEVVLSS